MTKPFRKMAVKYYKSLHGPGSWRSGIYKTKEARNAARLTWNRDVERLRVIIENRFNQKRKNGGNK